MGEQNARIDTAEMNAVARQTGVLQQTRLIKTQTVVSRLEETRCEYTTEGHLADVLGCQLKDSLEM